MISEHHMRQALARYLSGEVSLPEFQEWFVPRAWETLAEGGPAVDLVGQIELRLAEFTGGYQDETELRQALKQYADAPMILLGDPHQAAPVFYRTSNTSVGAEIGDSTFAIGGSIYIQVSRIEPGEKPVAA